MHLKTQFEEMIKEAFDKGEIDVSIEVKGGKVLGCEYSHNIENTKKGVEYFLTSISPKSLFKKDGNNFSELEFNLVIQNLQNDLHENLLIDTALERLRLHFSEILRKPEEQMKKDRFYQRHERKKKAA